MLSREGCVRGEDEALAHFLSLSSFSLTPTFSHFRTSFSLSPPQEYLKDYGTEEMKKIGDELIKKEMDTGLTDSAKRLLTRKMEKVEKGELGVAGGVVVE